MREKHTEQQETAAVSNCESLSDEVGDVAKERNNDVALDDFEIEDTDEDEELDVDQEESEGMAMGM